MANERIVERRRVYLQYKEDVKERGKPFYPYAMLHDTIMSLVVVSVTLASISMVRLKASKVSFQRSSAALRL